MIKSKFIINGKITGKNVTIGDKVHIMKKKTNTTGLTTLERILIPSILRKESDYKSLIVTNDLKKKVQLTQDEIKKFELRTEGQSLVWNEKGAKSIIEYDLTEFEKLEIKLALQKLDQEKKLSSELISLYDKFVK